MQKALKFSEFFISESKRKLSQDALISEYHDRLFYMIRSDKRKLQTEIIHKVAKDFLPIISKFGFDEKTSFLLIEFLIVKMIDDHFTINYLERFSISHKDKGKIAQLFLNKKLQKLVARKLKKDFTFILRDSMSKKNQDLYSATTEYLKETPYDAIDNVMYDFFSDISVEFHNCFEKIPVLILLDFRVVKDEFESSFIMKFKKVNEDLENVLIENFAKILREIKNLDPRYYKMWFSRTDSMTILNLSSDDIIDFENYSNHIIDIFVKHDAIEIAKIAQTTNVARKVGIID